MGRRFVLSLFVVALLGTSALALSGCGGGDSDPFVGIWVGSEEYANAELSMEIAKTGGGYESINTATGERDPLTVQGDTLVGYFTIVEGAKIATVHRSMDMNLLKTRITLEAMGSDLDDTSTTVYWTRQGSNAVVPKSKSLTPAEFQYLARIKAEQKRVRRVVKAADDFLAAFSSSKQPYPTMKQVADLNKAIDSASGVMEEWNKREKTSSRMERLTAVWADALRHLGAFLNGLVESFNKLGTGSNTGASIDKFLDERDEAARSSQKTTREIARLLKAYPPE